MLTKDWFYRIIKPGMSSEYCDGVQREENQKQAGSESLSHVKELRVNQ